MQRKGDRKGAQMRKQQKKDVKHIDTDKVKVAYVELVKVQ
jgi:hypothetical protein